MRCLTCSNHSTPKWNQALNHAEVNVKHSKWHCLDFTQWASTKMQNHTAHCSLVQVICQDFSTLEYLFRMKAAGVSLGGGPSDVVFPLSRSKITGPACDPTCSLIDKHKTSFEAVWKQPPPGTDLRKGWVATCHNSRSCPWFHILASHKKKKNYSSSL